MSSPSPLDRLRPHAVPVTIFSIVVVVTSIVPPLVLGAVSTRSYTITAAVLILAVGSVLPYSLLVAVGTLPLLYTGLASYAAPRPSADEAYSFSTMAAIRHVVAGVAYVLSAGVVGAIGFGAQMGPRPDCRDPGRNLSLPSYPRWSARCGRIRHPPAMARRHRPSHAEPGNHLRHDAPRSVDSHVAERRILAVYDSCVTCDRVTAAITIQPRIQRTPFSAEPSTIFEFPTVFSQSFARYR